MGFPKFSDSDERMLELLAQIAQNTGSAQQETTQQRGQQSGPVPIDPRRFHVVETPDLEDANPDGTVTIEPGETVELARYDATACHLIGVGAKTQRDVFYRLRADHEKNFAGGWRTMPFGTLGSPYSFVNELGLTFPIEEQIVYEAKLPDGIGSTVDISGKILLRL